MVAKSIFLSVIEETELIADEIERDVNMIRIDDIVIKKNLKPPFVIKADVQGAELIVLEGCSKILENTEVIILEVSLFKFMKEGPDFYDVVDYMNKIGYEVYDIHLNWNRPLDKALGQVDLVFVKSKGFFKKSNKYA